MFEATITPEEIARVNSAMEQSNGVVVDAAKILGLTTGQLHDKLRQRAFRERWKKKKARPPSEDIGVARSIKVKSSVPAATIMTEAQTAEILEKEDAAIRRGINKLGFTGKALEAAMSLQSFHRGHFKTVVDLLGGGLTQQFLSLLSDVEDCRALIKSEDLEPEELEVYLKYHIDLLEQMNRMYDRVVNASLVSAKIQSLRSGGGGPGGKNRKPSFSALKVATPGAQDGPPTE